MLAGYTRSGKIIFAGLCIQEGRVSLLHRKAYTLEDHYDAHCVFSFLRQAYVAFRADSEFSNHYALLARLHKEAILSNKCRIPPALLIHLDDSQLDEKYRRGSFLAKFSAIPLQEFR